MMLSFTFVAGNSTPGVYQTLTSLAAIRFVGYCPVGGTTMLAHAPINETNDLVQKLAKNAIRKQRRAMAGKFILAFFGLALFAIMGYFLGNFFIGLHLKWPWYFPH
jgi:hypothetical protein